MEALQSCLPHQLDLRTGQLWAEGRSTLQLHQEKPTPDVRGLLLMAVVLPPDSEVVANFSINGGTIRFLCINCSQSGFNGRIWSCSGTHISGRIDAVSKRLNSQPQRGRSGIAMWFTCLEVGPRVGCVGGPFGITITNKHGQ